MRKTKLKLSIVLIFGLAIPGILFSNMEVSAASNPNNAPADWAFDASSVELNDVIVTKYPSVDSNGDGFISISEATNYIGTGQYGKWILLTSKNISGTLNGIEYFKQMEVIELNQNNFTGEIPSSIGNMSNLRWLNLESNQLIGGIPSDIGNLVDLSSLTFSENFLSGEIPESIGKLINLNTLYLEGNLLSGEIPSTIGNMTNLRNLHLSYNKLKGGLPESLVNTPLTELVINNNEFTSINQNIFNFITNSQITYKNTKKQTNTKALSDKYIVDENITFNSLPVYEQLPGNGIPISYKLVYPDKSEKMIVPIVLSGKVTIDGTDLSQAGEYSLIATTENTAPVFGNSEYITNFTLNKSINYINATANGKANSQTTTKITIELSEDIADFALENITIYSPEKSVMLLNLDSLVSLGNGMYELSISGDWSEGDTITLKAEKDGYEFTPESHLVALHKKVESNNENKNGNENTDMWADDKRLEKLPQTGNNNFLAAIIIIVGSLVTSSYLIRRKEGR